MKYCGRDLHSNNSVVVVSDEDDRIVLQKRLPNDLSLIRSDFELPMLIPGIRINTSPTDFLPIRQLRLQRFDGKQWVLFGEVRGN